MTVERRFIYDGGKVEIREEDGVPHITGHGAIFNEEVEIFRGFREVVRPGAFTKTIQEADVRGLFNHDANFVLGRNRAGTMKLSEDDQGLLYDIVAPDTDLVRDLVLEPMRRGDITGSSFGFQVVTQRWTENEEWDLRELLEVKLYDVGPVTFPAYPTTDAQVRSTLQECTTPAEVEFFAFLAGSGLTPEQAQAMMKRKAELADDRGSQSEPTSAGWNDRMRAKLRLLSAGA